MTPRQPRRPTIDPPAPPCAAVLAHRTDYWTWVDLHSSEPNLPRVAVRNRNGSHEAVCAHWPHNIRPDGYYLGAYTGHVPDTGDTCPHCKGTGRISQVSYVGAREAS